MSAALISTIPPRLASVPAFPPVVMRLLSLFADENSAVSAIAACIANDPVFSARILKRANAADVARFEPARDVLQALVNLGMARTRELALTTATIAYLGSALTEKQLRICWRHTVACAMAAAEVARACGMQPAEPYTAGLLHDLGRLGLITAFPLEYERAMTDAGRQGVGLLSVERDRFGVDHTEAGQWLAERWKLPDSLALAAARHHDLPSGDLDVLATVQAGCRLADLLGFSVTGCGETAEFDEIAAVLPEAARVRLREALPRLQSEIIEQISYFGCSEPGTQVGPVEVKIVEEEESDFLADFPAPGPRPAHPSPGGPRWVSIALPALRLLAALVLFPRG